MRPSKIRRKLDAGKVVRICGLGSDIAYYPQLAAHFGYDAVWVDGEHRAWEPHQIAALFARHHLADIDCLYRPPTLEKSGLARLLEDGASALMIPQVNSVARAKEMVDHTKYPPLGDRGLDGAGLDAGYWVKRAPDYVTQANRETVLVLQIETPAALEVVDEIAALPGVDALLLGPGDLSLRLGCTGSIRDPQIRAAAEKVNAACKRHGKAWGMPVGNIEDAKTVVELGCQLLSLSNDFLAIHDQMKTNSQLLDGLLS